MQTIQRSAHLVSAVFLASIFFPLEVSGQRGPERDGFMGVPWGTPLAMMQQRFDLVLATSQGRQQQYHATIPSLPGIELDLCEFEFTDSVFSGVVMMTDSRQNSHQLRKYLESLFGDCHESDPLGCQWLSALTHVFYDEGIAGNAYVYWYSRKFQPEPMEEKR